MRHFFPRALGRTIITYCQDIFPVINIARPSPMYELRMISSKKLSDFPLVHKYLVTGAIFKFRGNPLQEFGAGKLNGGMAKVSPVHP
jgi:hypothetical protein